MGLWCSRPDTLMPHASYSTNVSQSWGDGVVINERMQSKMITSDPCRVLLVDAREYLFPVATKYITRWVRSFSLRLLRGGIGTWKGASCRLCLLSLASSRYYTSRLVFLVEFWVQFPASDSTAEQRLGTNRMPSTSHCRAS